jgi:5-methylcytosine-specific restriction endonuclease McrA
MTMDAAGHRFRGKTCPICGRGRRRRSGASRPELNQRRWKTLARAIKERDGNACRGCGSTERLQVHHLRPGSNHPHDLITVCPRCHSGVHSLDAVAR